MAHAQHNLQPWRSNEEFYPRPRPGKGDTNYQTSSDCWMRGAPSVTESRKMIGVWESFSINNIVRVGINDFNGYVQFPIIL